MPCDRGKQLPVCRHCKQNVSTDSTKSNMQPNWIFLPQPLSARERGKKHHF